MTQVITRFFDSAAQARLVKQELRRIHRFSPRIMELYDAPESLTNRLISERVDPQTAQAYAERMANGGAVLLVRAGYKPLAVARTAREVTAQMGAADMGSLTEEVYIKELSQPSLSVLEGQPLMLTRPKDPDSDAYHMADWPIGLISRRKPSSETVIPPHGRMASWPIGLLVPGQKYMAKFPFAHIVPGHGHMANFPIPLISRRKPYTGSIFPPHARMANFPIPLISRRKPKDRTIIGRHTRMANWPFPLLINGKTGTNALMPDGPRMANWPIRLLSSRRPYTGSIFPHHARMANFPIPLISRREPYTGSVIPRHGRMADAILPLVIRREDAASREGGDGFSFSRMLGIPTVIRR